MEKNAKSVVSEKNYYSLPRGRVTGGMALWGLYTHSVTSLGGKERKTCTIKHFLQRELRGDSTKGAFRKPLPALFLTLSSLGIGLAPSAHSPPRPGAELAIP